MPCLGLSFSIALCRAVNRTSGMGEVGHVIQKRRRTESLRKSVKTEKEICDKVLSEERRLSVMVWDSSLQKLELWDRALKWAVSTWDKKCHHSPEPGIPSRRKYPPWNIQRAGVPYAEMIMPVLRLYPHTKVDF